MASAIIHICVAKKLKEHLKINNEYDYYLGSIAPDIAKQVGQTKQKSHFLYNEKEDVPNIKMFEDKYPNYKSNDFLLGYFIHLYTDKLWFDRFMEKLYFRSCIKLLDGTVINVDEDKIIDLIYQDYTNLNIRLIDEYELDLSLFYEEFKKPNVKMDEIPVERLNILIDKMGIIIENSKVEKAYMFDMDLVNEFIYDVVGKLKDYLNIIDTRMN